MADIMTRWCHGYRGKILAVKRITHKCMENDVVPTSLAENFKDLGAEMIRSS